MSNQEKPDTPPVVEIKEKCWQQDKCLDYPSKCEGCYTYPKNKGQKIHCYFPVELISLLNEVSFYQSVIKIAEAMPKVLKKLGIE